MVSDSSDLPFFPKYETEYVYDEIRVTWFEPHFSQSHYNFNTATNGSNACTLIAILMASKCHKNKISIGGPHKAMNSKLIFLLAESMLEGNRIHDELKSKKVLRHINLNVPEAIKYADTQAAGLIEWKSLVYMESLSESLFTNVKTNWIEWVKTNSDKELSDLYIILVADSRTVLLIFQHHTDTVTLVDSHQHSSSKGAFIAIVRRQRLKLLCHWFNDIINKYYKSDPQLYELSFLYFKKEDGCH